MIPDIDLWEKFVAGTRMCVERLVADHGLEAYQVAVDARVVEGDLINT